MSLSGLNLTFHCTEALSSEIDEFILHDDEIFLSDRLPRDVLIWKDLESNVMDRICQDFVNYELSINPLAFNVSFELKIN